LRLNINLATKPYQDVRRVLLQWGGLVLLLALCTGGLLWMAFTNWKQSREVNAKIAGLNSEIAALDRQHGEALALVQLPQNRPVLDDSKFLNGLIARKSFSWTRVFMQLEEIMPPKLHVVSIQPSLSPKTDTVEVHMSVAGTSRDAAVELVKRLEQSPSFRDARIEEESSIKQQKESTDTVQFHLTAVYVPLPAPAATTAESNKEAAPTGKAAGSKPAESKAAKSKAAGTKPAGTKVADAKGGTQ
jgi:type IV pilus assembly protein PilN